MATDNVKFGAIVFLAYCAALSLFVSFGVAQDHGVMQISRRLLEVAGIEKSTSRERPSGLLNSLGEDLRNTHLTHIVAAEFCMVAVVAVGVAVAIKSVRPYLRSSNDARADSRSADLESPDSDEDNEIRPAKD